MNRIFQKVILAAILCLTGASCRSVNHLMKAKATEPDRAFLDFRQTPAVETARSPWHYAAFSADRKTLAEAARKRRIFIAPVATRSLRPISKKLARKEYAGARPAQVREISGELRSQFARYLAPAGYEMVRRPGPDTLILELNLIELNPTSAPGNVTKTVVKFTVGPLFSMGVGLFTGGSIAIEGRLRDGATGAVFMQFADREKDKATFYNARDYMPLGHAKKTAQEWAEQFALFLHDRHRKIKDTFFFTPLPY